MRNGFDISELELYAVDLLKNKIGLCDSVYTDRPKSTETSEQYFAVTKVMGQLVDMAAYGSCTLAVQIFARDVRNLKNARQLSILQKKLLAGFPHEDDKYIFDDEPTVVADVADDYGYHCRTLLFKTLIKAI